MRTKKLTFAGKILVSILVVIFAVTGLYFSGAFTKAKNQISKIKSSKSSEQVFSKKDSSDDMYKKAGAIKKQNGVLNLSLDEWIGWKSIIDANGGLRTTEGSIYDQLGLKVNISVINDASQSSSALIKGDLDGAGYTVNRYAFLYNKFKENKTPVKMGFITNSSTGGDGIIAKKGINSIEDLVGKKVGYPRYSEAQTLIEWLLQKSTLSDDQIKQIRNNMVPFDTPDDCAKAFFAGQLDAAATWEPYLSQAESATSSHVLFSTKDATNIILDGIVFREDFINNHKEEVKKLLEGALKASDDYKKDAGVISQTFPMFATQSAEDTLKQADNATLYNCKSNVDALKDGGTARSLFKDMSVIWNSLGEDADPANADNAFYPEAAESLVSEFSDEKVNKPVITEKQKTIAEKQDNKEALLTQRLTINFEVGSAAIDPSSYKDLQEFAKTASILDGTVIQVEGNTDSTGDATLNKTLSEKRARSVAMYLQAQGIDSSRFIVKGNGPDCPIASNDTADGMTKNRRTDMYFKSVK